MGRLEEFVAYFVVPFNYYINTIVPPLISQSSSNSESRGTIISENILRGHNRRRITKTIIIFLFLSLFLCLSVSFFRGSDLGFLSSYFAHDDGTQYSRRDAQSRSDGKSPLGKVSRLCAYKTECVCVHAYPRGCARECSLPLMSSDHSSRWIFRV